MAVDKASRPGNRSDEPAQGGVAITPSDSTLYTPRLRSLYVGTTGDVAVTGADGEDVTFKNVPAGAILPIRCYKVKSTGTTASNIVGLY
jgi:hypothetical protein